MDKIQVIDNLIGQNRLDDALKLCDCSDHDVLARKVKILLRLGKIEAAKEICEDEKNVNDGLIVYEYLKYLFNNNNTKDAFKICMNPNFYELDTIMSIKMGLLNRQGEYVKALHISDNPIFKNSERILEQRVLSLFKVGKIEDAIKICDDPRYIDTEGIQLRYIDYCHANNQTEKALKRCERKSFEKNIHIKRKEVRMLIGLKRYEEAKNICLVEGLKERKSFQDMLRGIEPKLNCRTDIDTSCASTIEKILLKIYAGNIELSEIENSNIDMWSKEILRLAYYDKFYKSKAIIYAKELKKKYVDDAKKVRFLNILCTYLGNKKITYFDLSKYTEYLNVLVDLSKADEYKKEEVVIPIPQVMKKTSNIEVKVEKKAPIIPKRTAYVMPVMNKVKPVIKPAMPKENVVVKPKVYIIKNVFPELCEKIFRSTYVLMQDYDIERRNNAITFYDNFELFIEKELTVERAMRFMLVLDRNFKCSIKYDKGEFKKHLKKIFNEEDIKKIYHEKKNV